jgi:hypothetical protein
MFDWPTVVTGTLGGVGGSLLVVFGLSRWLGDVWKGQIAENLAQANRRNWRH